MSKRLAVILLTAAMLLTGCKNQAECEALARAKNMNALPVRSSMGQCQVMISTADGYDSVWVVLREVGYGK